MNRRGFLRAAVGALGVVALAPFAMTPPAALAAGCGPDCAGCAADREYDNPAFELGPSVTEQVRRLSITPNTTNAAGNIVLSNGTVWPESFVIKAWTGSAWVNVREMGE